MKWENFFSVFLVAWHGKLGFTVISPGFPVAQVSLHLSFFLRFEFMV